MEVVAITPAGLRRVHESTTDTAALIESIRKMHSSLGPQELAGASALTHGQKRQDR